MMFLIQNFLYATCVLTTFSRFTHNARWILLICAALLAAIIPGLQYDVGSDYFAYIRLYLMYPGAFTERGGLAFEFFLSSLRLFDLDAQWLFFFAAVLFFFIFNVSMIYLNRNSISLMLFLVWFLFCSGLLHLHINGVRFSLCVALLFLSFICRFNKSNLLAVLFATASLLTHQLALFVFWIIFIPEAVFFLDICKSTIDLFNHSYVSICYFLKFCTIFSVDTGPLRTLLQTRSGRSRYYQFNNKSILFSDPDDGYLCDS